MPISRRNHNLGRSWAPAELVAVWKILRSIGISYGKVLPLLNSRPSSYYIGAKRPRWSYRRVYDVVSKQQRLNHRQMTELISATLTVSRQVVSGGA